MFIQKKYNTEARHLWDKVEKEIQEENMRLTEAEKTEIKRKNKQELKQIIDSYEEKIRMYDWIPDESKLKRFEEIAKSALWLSREIEADITIDSENNNTGKIILEMEWFIIQENSNLRVKRILCEMIMQANDIQIGCSGSICKMEFSFYLTKMVLK